MNENKKCPKCGATIAAEWKHELCPACLMQAGFSTKTQGDAAGVSARADQPTVEGIQPLDNGQDARASLAIDDVRKLFPQLEIMEQIGRGGMGVVYKARQPQLDRMVALKILSVGPGISGAHSSFAERFAREARALAKLNHPNIVSVFDFGQAGDHFYFIMEFVDGANLRQMIAAKQITPETALTIVPKVCEALQFAHDEGILHRDIKPENILIDKKGRVKIADFGLAKLIGDDTVDHSLTGTQQIMGTPRYMAPEQFENTKTVDHRADIYSLGVVFYEMLTGEIPMGRFALPSKKVQVDVRIDEVVLRSLEREPSQRYQHVSEVKTDVDNITHHNAPRSGGTPAAASMGDRSVAPLTAGNSGDANFQSLERTRGRLVLAGIAIMLGAFAAFYMGACNFEVYSKNKGAAFLIALVSVVFFSAGLGTTLVGFFKRQVSDADSRLRAWQASVAVAGFTAAGVMLLWGFGANFTGPGVPPRTDMLVWLPYAFALIGSVILLCRPGATRPSGVPPEIVLATLGVAIAALPWRGLEHLIPNPWSLAVNSAWQSSEGAMFSLVYLALGLFLLITGGNKPRSILRQAITLATGLIALGLIWHFVKHPPPSNAPNGFGYLDHRYNVVYPSMIYQSNFMVAVITAFLTVLVGAIQLRNRAGAESETGVPTTGKPGGANFQSLESRLSGRALWGALLTVPGLAIWIMLMRALVTGTSNEGAWMAGGGKWETGMVANTPGGAVLFAIMAVIGLAALFKSASLGRSAVAQIKASGGKLYGLPLGVFASAFFPVLVIGTVALFLAHIAQIAFWTKTHTSYSYVADKLTNVVAPNPAHRPIATFILIDVLFASVVSFFAARFAWRKIAGVEVPTTGNSGGANFQTLKKPLDHRVTEMVTKGIPGWFNARAKWVQSLVQGVLMVVWLIGLFAFLSFNFRASSGPGMSEKTIAIGVPAPWLEIISGTMESRWMIHPLAPSVVLALIGAAAAFIYEKIRRSRPGFGAEKDRRTARIALVVMGVVFAVFIGLAVILTVRKPGGAVRQAFITEDASVDAGAVSGVNRIFRYNVNAPVNHRVAFWAEYWRDGKLDKKVGLTGGFQNQFPRGASFEGGYEFSLADGAKTSPDAAGKVRWEIFYFSRLRDHLTKPLGGTSVKTHKDDARGGYGDWIADPFAGMDVVSSWGKVRKWNVTCCAATTLMILRGYGPGETMGDDGEDVAKQGKACILLKARIDAVPPSEQVEHSQTTVLDAAAVEKLSTATPRPESLELPDKPKTAFVAGKNGPELSGEAVRDLKLPALQAAEVNKILQRTAAEARALERRHTKIEKKDQGHVLVTISHYSTQCLALASNMVAELGGIVPQNILPAVRPGGLPAVVFGGAGECRTEIEMWKDDGKYHLNVRTRDWLPAPGISRSDSSFSNVGPNLENTFYGDYRLYWTEE